MPLCAGIHATTILCSSFSSSHLSISLLILFPIHYPEVGVILYVFLTTAVLSM
jgi:hypothetical protein